MTDITFCKFTNKDKPALINEISIILNELEAHNYKDDIGKLWNWRHEKLPSFESHVYVAKSKNRIIAYYHIPCYISEINGKSSKIGHIQTIAVNSSFRGKGVFQKLSRFANQDINNYVDMVYSFPNKNSIHTLIKYDNFKLVGTLPVYILPVNIGKIITSKYKIFKGLKLLWSSIDAIFRFFSKKVQEDEKIKTFKKITPEIENLFSEFGKKYQIKLHRNEEYLSWRYINSPKGIHKIYGLIQGDYLTAVVVVKKENIFSVNGIVIMEMAYQNPKDLQKLLCNIIPQSHEEFKDELSFIFVSGLNKGINSLRNCGFIPIPQKLVPRKLNLLARSTNKGLKIDIGKSSSWLISMGDWDVF